MEEDQDQEGFKAPAPASASASASASDQSGKRDASLNMERNRRDKMTELYDTLQSMVPDLFPKATRSRIIENTISYIKTLEDVFVALDTLKKQTEPAAAAVAAADTSPAALLSQRGSNVSVAVSPAVGGAGSTAFFGIASTSRTGLLSKAAEVFEKHNADVLAATVARDDAAGTSNVTVTAVLSEEDGAMKIRDDLMNI